MSPIEPMHLDALLTLARAQYDGGHFDRAADLCRFAALVDPLRHETWWMLGACLEQRDEIEAAAEVYAIGHDLCPDSVDLALLLARARLNAGDRLAAREALDAARAAGLGEQDAARAASVERCIREAQP